MRGLLLLGLGVGLLGCGGDEETPRDTRETEAGDSADSAEDVPADVDEVALEIDAETGLPDVVAPPDRRPGERRARTARCDETEPAVCLLPWPSSAFLEVDAQTATGVRVAVSPDAVLPDDGLEALSADGFSRISPIVLRLPDGVGADDVEVRLYQVEPEVVVREVDTRLVFGRNPNDRDTLVAYPRAPLMAGREHNVVVLAKGETKARWAASRITELALGAVAETSEEAAIAAHHAPARGIVSGWSTDEREQVVRLWDFVTRSAEDPRARLRSLANRAKEAVQSGLARIVLERAEVRDGPIAMIVFGSISGLPDEGGEGEQPTFAVPFRVVVPAGVGDYRYVLYSHGTSGDVRDTAFDELIAGSGAAKVNVEIDGWTEASLGPSISGLLVPIEGSRSIVEKMRRSFAGIAAIHAAIDGPLGELLAADTILGVDNPEAGRGPRIGPPIWTGGSLGGVVGAVYGQLEPSVAGGVLNVPGAGFTHWLAQSEFTSLLDLALASRYPAMVEQQVMVALSQTIWDEVDGAIWADARVEPPVFLVQISIGDPVMPAVGTHMVARSLGAVMTVPEGVDPIVGLDGLERAELVVGRTGYTEFKTSETSATAVHGFAARDSEAGKAARDQIQAFIRTLWDGTPVIGIPQRCLEAARPGVCDFSE